MATLTKNDRLDVRMPAQLKQLIERAAAQVGQSVSDFVNGTLADRARRVIHESEVIELSDRDRDCFLASLDNQDAKPNADLRRAAERHKAATG